MTVPHLATLAREFARSQTRWQLLPDRAAAERWAEALCAQLAEAGVDQGFAAVGRSWARALIAETGTVVLAGGPGSDRRSSLCVRQHVVLVRAADIVADLGALLAGLDGATLHDTLGSHLTLITGPSRTADIEKILVLPAHGPAGVWVGIVEHDDAA